MVDLVSYKSIMDRYKNLGGDSNVSEYEIGADHIVGKFLGTIRTYRYSYSEAGQNQVESLKKLAQAGRGLKFI